MGNMWADSPHRGKSASLTAHPLHIATPLVLHAILYALRGHPVPVLESGRGR